MENFASVTDPVTPDDTAPPPPLTAEARSAFGVIADWCETQRGEAETTAGRQFRTIWWLLGGGLVLLLTLPLIIAYIDHYLGLEESLPPVVVAEAKAAKALLAANQSEMQQQVIDATVELDRLQVEIATGEANLAVSETVLRTAITSPLAVWRRSAIAGLEASASILALIRAPDGTLFAAGLDGTNALLLRSTDGVDWAPARLEVRLPGSINALMVTPDGTLLAAGSMTDRGGTKALLLRSTDGVDWTTIRLGEPGGLLTGRLPGEIFALMATPDGTLFAAGLEGDYREPKVLLLRSTDGADWTPVRPEAAGERLAGAISALLAAPDGTLFAAGWEGDIKSSTNILLLRSTDGSDWTPVLPEAAGGAAGGGD